MQQSLFVLQTELVDAKVEVSVSQAIAAVIEQIVSLRQDKYNQIRTRFLDNSFKAGWLVIFSLLSGFFSLLAFYLHSVL